MLLHPGVHQIESLYGGRKLYQYLFIGEQTVLLDSGIGATPEKAIFPYLESIGLSPQNLTLAITMHADLDHQGGNAALRAAAPSLLLACHEADRPLIEDPEALYRLRYDHLRREHGAGAPRDIMADAGRATPMNLCFTGGESLRLGAQPGGQTWGLQLWHVPGHSAGHLAVYDPLHRAVFTSDAVQGWGNPDVFGGMAFGPTYYAVDAYLATIHFLEGQPIEHLYSGHWPDAHGAAVRAFLTASCDFVHRAEDLLSKYLENHPRGVTLTEAMADLSPRLGDWPRRQDWLMAWALYGHLLRREEHGQLLRLAGPPVSWRLA